LTQVRVQTIGPKPKNSTHYYCPESLLADSANHVTAVLEETDASRVVYQPSVLASYTADAAGNLTTTNTYKNMPALPGTAGGLWTSVSPSGKYIVAGGGHGLYLYHFNWGAPVTQRTVLLGTQSVKSASWDNANHLYAATNQQLYVFTVTDAGISQAPGSPYFVPLPTGVFVQPQ
jgi:hypothetical protein